MTADPSLHAHRRSITKALRTEGWERHSICGASCTGSLLNTGGQREGPGGLLRSVVSTCCTCCRTVLKRNNTCSGHPAAPSADTAVFPSLRRSTLHPRVHNKSRHHRCWHHTWELGSHLPHSQKQCGDVFKPLQLRISCVIKLRPVITFSKEKVHIHTPREICPHMA